MKFWKCVLLAVVLVCSGCDSERIGEVTSVFKVQKIEKDQFKDRFGYERHTGYLVEFTDGRNRFVVKIPVCDTYSDTKLRSFELPAKIILYSDGEILITKINMTDDSLKNALLKAACL